MPERPPGEGTNSVHAGRPPADPHTPSLPGPVFVSHYHLPGDASGPYTYGRDENPTWTHLEAAISSMKLHGRAAICGMIAQYNETEPPAAPRNLALLIGKRLTLRGFLVGDHGHLRGQFVQEMSGWLREGKIAYDETVVDGIDTLDASLARALAWGAAWDMTRDAEMAAGDYVSLVLRGVGRESDLTAVAALCRQAQHAVSLYSDPAGRDRLCTVGRTVAVGAPIEYVIEG